MQDCLLSVSISHTGVLQGAGSITVPSLASVYNEFALKKHMDTSVLLQVSVQAPVARLVLDCPL